ncbi:MAG: 2-phospho-L-lactate guanylyltransferase (cofC) [Cenarchaeum symbiont of Oopsacas minuta]|nr:2-phospho-L-lactate guanylyltransferase (cofC) [Cenarchaeum symbiont of Oopsacas minuta]
MKIAAIVPVKTFERAKSRLGLGHEKTVNLCNIMLKEVLSALTGSSAIDTVTIVSREPLAETVASEFGVDIIPDKSESGVNNAVALGEAHYANKGHDGLLVVPQDLPLLMSTDVDELVRLSCRPPCVTVVPSRMLDGTNALLRAPSNSMPTRYDEGSYLAHMQEARKHNLNPLLVYQRRVMADIDSIDDIEYCIKLGEKPQICEQIAYIAHVNSSIDK